MDNTPQPMLHVQQEMFEMVLLDVQKACHKNAVDKGFYDEAAARNVGEALMLCVTELAEACEAARKGDDENFAEELADTMIRIMDLAEHMDINLAREIVNKMKINMQRPPKHGKKF